MALVFDNDDTWRIVIKAMEKHAESEGSLGNLVASRG